MLRKLSGLFVLVAMLALVPNVSAVGYMDGANWTGIDNIWDSLGMSYLKNSSLLAGSNVTLTKYANGSVLISSTAGGVSGMSNPATADLDMDNNSITNVGTPFCSGASYCVFNQSGTTISVNGTTQNVDYSGTVAETVVNNSLLNAPLNGIVIISNNIEIINSIAIPSNRTLIIRGEIKRKDNSQLEDTPIIQNLNKTTYDENINLIFEGGYLNGNNDTQTNAIAGGYNRGNPIHFYNVSGLNMQNTRIINPYLWAIRIVDTSNFTITDTDIQSTGLYRDGLHIVDSHTGIINNLRGNTGDDLLAISTKYKDSYDIIVNGVVGTSTRANGIRINQESETRGIVNTSLSNIIITGININNTALNCITLSDNENSTSYYNIVLEGICSNPGSSGIVIGGSVGDANATLEGIHIDMEISNSSHYGMLSAKYDFISNSTFNLRIFNSVNSAIRMMRVNSSTFELNVNTLNTTSNAVKLGIANYNLISGNINGGDDCIELGDPDKLAFYNSIQDLICTNAITSGIHENTGSNYNRFENILTYNVPTNVILSGEGSYSSEEKHNQSYVNILRNGDFESFSSGTSSSPDGWINSGGSPTFLRNSSYVKYGNYSLTITTNNVGFRQNLEDYYNVTQFREKTYTLGAWVYSNVADRVSVRINDGVARDSTLHTGSGWEYLKVTKTISSTATVLRPQMWITSGTSVTATIDGAIMVEGRIVSAYSPKPLEDDGYSIQINSTSNNVTIPNLITTNLTSSAGTNLLAGGLPFTITNGTNVIGVDSPDYFYTVYPGTLTKLLAHSQQTGSINVSFWNASNSNSYIDSVLISAGTDGSQTLSYAFGDETLIKYNVTSVTDIKQVSIALKTTKS